MKKYYQVFISSVSREFSDVRPVILERLMKQDRFFPVAMEYMTGNTATIPMLLSYMQNSDIYVLILGNEIGTPIGQEDQLTTLYKDFPTLPIAVARYMEDAGITDPGAITYTELEYILASALGKKAVAFVRADTEAACNHDQAIPPASKRFYTAIRKPSKYEKWSTAEELCAAVIDHINRLTEELQNTKAGWIRETDSDIYQATASAGIADVSLDGKIDSNALAEHLMQSDAIKLFYTTGARFLSSFEIVLAQFVARGGHIQLLCAKPESEMLNEVQQIEEAYLNSSRATIHKEFDTLIELGQNILGAAKKQNQNNNLKNETGTIQLGFSKTLFRSSILICEKDRQPLWGWLTITLPPFKSKDTISMEMIPTKETPHTALIERAAGHFDAAWEIAKSHNEVYTIDSYVPSSLKKPQDSKHLYWKEKEKSASLFMRHRIRKKGVLIEVAAQHPLVDGLYPNKEFSARLDVAIEIYRRETAKGLNVEIYVPGSLHLDYNGIPDECSLSEAGCRYLSEAGIPQEAIHGEDLNGKYNESRYYTGVYNTADECYVAAHYFHESTEFRQLITVCSPNQLMRKTLFYLEHNIIPMVITVPCEELSHNFLYELLESVPYLLYEDHDWQGKSSKEAIRTRKERDPDWQT